MNAPRGEGDSGAGFSASRSSASTGSGAAPVGDFLDGLAPVIGFALAAPGIPPRPYAQIGESSDRGYAPSQGCRDAVRVANMYGIGWTLGTTIATLACVALSLRVTTGTWRAR
jgi:hypothetical protein